MDSIESVRIPKVFPYNSRFIQVYINGEAYLDGNSFLKENGMLDELLRKHKIIPDYRRDQFGGRPIPKPEGGEYRLVGDGDIFREEDSVTLSSINKNTNLYKKGLNMEHLKKVLSKIKGEGVSKVIVRAKGLEEVL